MVDSSIKVLDHGYVNLVDYLGTDESVIEAARMSTSGGFVSWDPYVTCNICGTHWRDHGESLQLLPGQILRSCCDNQQFKKTPHPRGDAGLLEFLYKNRHTSPFEMCELVVEVQAPIMVFREWHRHRTMSYNEMSGRYTQIPNLHYLPTTERVQKQSRDNKQGSGESLKEADAAEFLSAMKFEQTRGYINYDAALNEGIAKEIARLNTPISRYSRMRAKANLANWLRFLHLRMAENAQWEIREYANAVASIIKELWPRTYALFEEHTLHATSLSRSEVLDLREYVNYLKNHGEQTRPANQSLLKRLGL